MQLHLQNKDTEDSMPLSVQITDLMLVYLDLLWVPVQVLLQ